MKNPIRILAALMIIAALAVNYGCKDDEDPAPLTLSTLTVGGADLNGATPPTGVATDASIEVNFSTTVDPATATSANIKLTRDYDDADVPLTITPDGTKITITPNDPLSSGNQYVLTISEAVKSDQGQALTAVTRNFTTAGFFALPDQAAHWSFENNGDDEMGVLNATNEIDITYVDGRNATAGKAISFNGETSIMEVPGASTLLSGPDFTVSFWIKPEVQETHGGFAFGLAAKYGFQFEVDRTLGWFKLAEQYDLGDNTTDNSEDNYWAGDGATKDNGGWMGWTFNKDVGGNAGVAAILANWTHIVCTVKGSTQIATMYVNGEKVKEHDFHLWPADSKMRNVKGVKYTGKPSPADILAFGFIQAKDAANRSLSDDYANYDGDNVNHYKGLLDDIRFYKKAITPNEVTLIYNSEK